MWSMVNGTHLRSSGQWHCDGANGGKRSAYISHLMREIVCDLASNAYSQYVKLGIDEQKHPIKSLTEILTYVKCS